jgi:hypothetical protein
VAAIATGGGKPASLVNFSLEADKDIVALELVGKMGD